MRLLVFADLHFMDYNKWREFLKIDHSLYDAVCLLGDIDILLYKSIKEQFSDKPMFGVLGNHDYLGDLEYYGIPNIHGKFHQEGTATFIGVEGCCRYKKGKDMPLHEQVEITKLLKELPSAEIVCSHNSPKSIHDKPDVAHEGYEGLIEYMVMKRPRYILHGHQHKNIRTKIENTEIIGMYGGVLFDTETGMTQVVLGLEDL